MDGHTLIINRLETLAQGLNADDRWGALRDMGGAGEQAQILWWILIAFGILAAGGTIAALIYARRQERHRWEKFTTLGQRVGLREKELALLERVARLVSLKDPVVIYTDDSVFNAATLGLMSSSQVAALPEKEQLNLQTTLVSMHTKLGFGTLDKGEGLKSLRSSRQIDVGSKIFVGKLGERELVNATIVGNSDTELTIASEEIVPGRRTGDDLTIRYAHNNGAWEFDVRVIRCEGQAVVVEHSWHARVVNLRRFPRVRTKMFATGAPIFFHISSCNEVLEFLPIEIVEIGGPTLLLEMPIEMKIGQNLLIRAQLNERRFVQGITKVRRIVTEKARETYVAVEFLGLSEDELTEMTRATNQAASHRGHIPSDSEMAMA